MAKILVIEDTPAHRRLEATVLEKFSHLVLLAANATEGIEIARRERPDLILMDISLPGMSGLEATRILKADASTRTIPVVAVTAYAMADEIARILAAGCTDYLTKPIAYKDMMNKVDAILRQGA